MDNYNNTHGSNNPRYTYNGSFNAGDLSRNSLYNHNTNNGGSDNGIVITSIITGIIVFIAALIILNEHPVLAYIILFALIIGFIAFLGYRLSELLSIKQQADKQKLGLSYADINRIKKNKIPHEIIINALKEAKNYEIDFTLDDIIKFRHNNINIAQFFNIITLSNTLDTRIDARFLKNFCMENPNVSKVLDAYVTVLKEGLNISLTELHFQFKNQKLDEYLNSILKIQYSDEQTRSLFYEITDSFGSEKIFDVINALEQKHRLKIEWDYEKLKDYVFKGGNLSTLIQAYKKSLNNKLEGITLDLLAEIALSDIKVTEKDRADDPNKLDKAIENAINESYMEIGPFIAIPKDRFPLRVTALVTYKYNLANFVKGQEISTIKAKLQEAIASEIGSFAKYKEVFEQPRQTSSKIKQKRIDNKSKIKIEEISIKEIAIGEDFDSQAKLERAQYERAIQEKYSEIDRQNADVQARKARAHLKEVEAKIKEAEAKNRENQGKKEENT